MAADSQALRALAHPLRIELLDLLRFEGPATATLLAHRTGESSGATSYHLRQLARYGYVEDEPGKGGRERWWRYRERRVDTGAGDEAAGVRHLAAELLSREAHALDRYLAERSRPPEWDDVSFFRSRALRLTPQELDGLRVAIEGLIEPLRAAEDEDAPSGAAPVRLVAFGFPQPSERA